MFFSQQSNTPLAYRRNPTPDTETLQTDVMRFMAILGLCLTAIFALLQSLPVSDTARADTPDLDTTEQRMRLAELERKINGATAQLNAVQHSREQTEKALRSAEQELLQTHGAFKKKHITPKSVTPSSNTKPAAKQGKNTAEIKAESAAMPTQSAPQEDGFTLRFASDTVFLNLLTTGRIQLFMIQHKDYWQLDASSGHITIHPSSAPGRIHEMNPDTVPRSLWKEVKNSGKLSSTASINWVVGLPDTTEQHIHSLVAANKGGALVIGEDAGVRLRKAGTE